MNFESYTQNLETQHQIIEIIIVLLVLTELGDREICKVIDKQASLGILSNFPFSFIDSALLFYIIRMNNACLEIRLQIVTP